MSRPGRAQRALRKTVPIVGQLAKDKRRVRQDVHLAVGRAAHTESGGGAEMKLDGGHLAGWPLWLLPATVKVLHAVVTGQRMAARGREDFANMESNVFELDRGAITLKKVADKALEENGIKQGDAQPAFLPGVDGELALLAMSVAFEGEMVKGLRPCLSWMTWDKVGSTSRRILRKAAWARWP